MFVAIGFLLSGLDLVSVQPRSEIVSLMADTTLGMVLFTDASLVRVSALRQDTGPVVLLANGLLLTIVLGTRVASAMSPAMPLAVALPIDSSLAPTDATLGQAVITDRAVPGPGSSLDGAEWACRRSWVHPAVGGTPHGRPRGPP